MGDGFCDDECNYGDCAYDGGDCCKPDADKTYCTECQCKTDTICPPVCIEMKGDGTCDDYCNTLNCEYDGGDCCGDNVQCGPGSSDCQCLNGAITTTTTATTTTTSATTTTTEPCEDIKSKRKCKKLKKKGKCSKKKIWKKCQNTCDKC